MVPYTYRATVQSVHDGDTITVDVDLGLGVWRRGQRVRLDGINARELGVPGGREARDNLAALVPAGSEVALRSVHWDKYGGRIDGAVTLADGRDLAAVLVEGQWAAAWDGSGPRPVPPWPRT